MKSNFTWKLVPPGPFSKLEFPTLRAPHPRNELMQLTHTIAHRVALYLERQGLLAWAKDSANFKAHNLSGLFEVI